MGGLCGIRALDSAGGIWLVSPSPKAQVMPNFAATFTAGGTSPHPRGTSGGSRGWDEQGWRLQGSREAGLPFALTLEHVMIGIVRDGEEVRGHLSTLLALVHLDHPGSVDWQPLVGVDGHAEQTRVRLEGEKEKTNQPA